MGHLENEKTSWLAFLACFVGYTIICMTKNTYSAAIAAIVETGLFTKASAGIINACFYFFYGVSQFVGGYLADRISPFKIILIGLLGSLLANAGMAVAHSFGMMLAIWSFNGVIQFGVWPAIVKILSSVLLKEHRSKAMAYISVCYPTGTILSYLAAMGVLKYRTWPALFVVSVIALLLAILFFLYVMHRVRTESVPSQPVSKQTEEKTEKKVPVLSAKSMLFSSGLILIFVPSLVRCMLDIGLKSWVPTMIMESYSISPSFASLLTTILLITNLFGIFIAVRLYPKYCKNLALAIGLLFLASLPLILLLLLNGKIMVVVIVLLLAIMTTFMTAAGHLLGINLPAAFGAYKKIGTVAGIINAFACFGCMLANFIYGYTAEYFGWNVTILIWAGIALLAFLFCLAAMPLWKRFTEKEIN